MKISTLIVVMTMVLFSCSNTQPDPHDDPKNPEPQQSASPVKAEPVKDTVKVKTIEK